MKNKHIVLVIALTISVSLFFGCKDTVTENQPLKPVPIYTDTLEATVSEGVIMKLSGVADTFRIKDRLSGLITLTNISDTNKFKVIFPIWPAWKVYVFDEKNKYVGSGPDGVSFIGLNYELSKGQSAYYEVYWSKNTFASVPGYVVLPAFNGKYKLEFTLSGNNKFYNKKVVKWVTIADQDTLTCFTFIERSNDFNYTLLDFGVRNRSENEFTLNVQDEHKAELQLTNVYNTEEIYFKDTFDVQTDKYIIQGKSDSLLFSYRLDKTLSQFTSFRGPYFLFIKIKFKEEAVLLREIVGF